MNNKIKEILNQMKATLELQNNLKGIKDSYLELREKDIKTLLDYITNLEECHENMFYINLENDKLIWDLQNENEKLKDTLNKIMVSNGETTTPVLDIIKEKEDYKSRKEKAVEYIENCPEYLWANVNTKVLLNILNGRSDE